MTDWAGFVVVRYQLGEYNILFAARVPGASRVRSIFCSEFKSSLSGSRIVENCLDHVSSRTRDAGASRVRSIFCCEFKSSLSGSRIVENSSSSKSVADDMFNYKINLIMLHIYLVDPFIQVKIHIDLV